MASAIEADVLVVGAGPVGLTLTLDLAQRGMRVLLIDKNDAPLRLPKMERSNPRTMEIWRRLGVMDVIRAVGLPPHMPMDVVVVRSLAEPPLIRQAYPSVNEVRARIAASDDGTQPREPYQLVSQYAVEPILLARAKQTPRVEVRQGTEFLSLEQGADGVTSQVKARDGSITTVRSSYVVGCDGGGSSVRKELGIKLEGAAAIGTIYNIFFRCDDLMEKSRSGFARHFCFSGLTAGGGAAGTIVVQGDMKHFALHIMTAPPEDPAALVRQVTGIDINPQILFCQPWLQHMVVAERHMDRRVFLAGDANHLYIPAGGLGMNTGIADAANLAWKLAAVLQGWGGPRVLDSYADERGAAARRNLRAASWAVEGVVGWRNAFDPKIFEDSPEGQAARKRFLQIAEVGNRRVYEMQGADLGYRYTSDIIDAAEGPAPECPVTEYIPTTWPGAHVPHLWLAQDLALYDRLSTRGYTLLALRNAGEEIQRFESAFRNRNAPLEVMRLSDARLRRVLERDLLLIRPDFHVAWRGNHAPNQLESLVNRVTGHY